MLPDLEQLIRLQQIDRAAADARDRIAAQPAARAALDARVAARNDAVDSARRMLAEHKTARAALEKDVAEIQTRLGRFKDQLMAVKPNREYHAIQSEIAGAEGDLQALEDRLLERMVEDDELRAALAAAEDERKQEERAVADERSVLDRERQELEATIAAFDAERAQVADQLTAAARGLFDTVARGRKGVAVAEASGGRCMACQVRLRPQLFNNVRLNSALIQCESCQRILYFAEHRHTTPAAEEPAPASQSSGS